MWTHILETPTTPETFYSAKHRLDYTLTDTRQKPLSEIKFKLSENVSLP